MLADFYIPRLSHDMNIIVQKNHLRGQILYRSSEPSKKRRHLFVRFFVMEIILKKTYAVGNKLTPS